MERPEIKILTVILDDNKDFIDVLQIYFKEFNVNHECKFFTDANAMLDVIDNTMAVICLIDYRLTYTDGIDVIRRVRAKNPLFCYIIVMSGLLTEQLVIDCVNLGGCNKILKKDNPDFLKLLIEYLKEGRDIAQDLFDKYAEVWERWLKTDKIFNQLIGKDEPDINDLGAIS